jgi:hypothetical protein
MIKAVDYNTIIHSIECEIFEMNEGQKIRIIAGILYPNEPYYSLTQTQLDKVRNLLNNFN